MTEKQRMEIVARRMALRPGKWSRCIRGGEQSHDAIWYDGPFGEQRVCVVEDTDHQPGVAAFIEHAREDMDTLLQHVHDLENEVARLKAGGCARDQGLTQFCAEAAEMSARVTLVETTNEHYVATIRRLTEERNQLLEMLRPKRKCICVLTKGFVVFKDGVCDTCGGSEK